MTASACGMSIGSNAPHAKNVAHDRQRFSLVILRWLALALERMKLGLSRCATFFHPTFFSLVRKHFQGAGPHLTFSAYRVLPAVLAVRERDDSAPGIGHLSSRYSPEAPSAQWLQPVAISRLQP